ncbi:MAG: hypothetical protein NWE78_04010, partial [Candidatus Bathyarchaeota archaeon]|nr:hypothetical protein [Candidatus Bathyarchaeota archaeon]
AFSAEIEKRPGLDSHSGSNSENQSLQVIVNLNIRARLIRARKKSLKNAHFMKMYGALAGI